MSPPSLVKPLMVIGLEPVVAGKCPATAGMHAQSAAAGTFPVDQFAALAQSELTAPVKLSVHGPDGGGVVTTSTAGLAAFPVLSTANTP